MNVLTYFVPKHHTESTDRKGSNELSPEELNSCFLFTSRESNHDVTLIVGYESNSKIGCMLLCQFHNLIPTLSNRKNQTKRKLFNDMFKQLKNNGIERRRVGGSCGFVSYSKELKLLIKTPNSTPRCGVGSVWIKHKSNLKWLVIYVRTRDGKLKHTYYSNPRHGGAFKMNSSLIDKYAFLSDFLSTKPIAALICTEMKFGKDVPIQIISPVATLNELSNLESARNYLCKELKKREENVPEFTKKNLFYKYYMTKFINFTLVLHPVGRHYDTFPNNVS